MIASYIAIGLVAVFCVWQCVLVVRDIRIAVKRRKDKSLVNDELKGE